MKESIHRNDQKMTKEVQIRFQSTLTLLGLILLYANFNKGLLSNYDSQVDVAVAVKEGPTIDDANLPDQYTLVVVNCQDNITWIEDVPDDWNVVLYEKCGMNNAKDHFSFLKADQLTVHKLSNQGAEECNGYLDYIYDYYYNLTSVTIFLHGDAISK
jgi:Protein of unknown function (DUF3431)